MRVILVNPGMDSLLNPVRFAYKRDMHSASLALCFAMSWPANVGPVPAIIPLTTAPSGSNFGWHAPRNDSLDVVVRSNSLWPGLEHFESPVRGIEDPVSSTAPSVFAWASLSCRQTAIDPRTFHDDPIPRDSTWASGESVKVPVYGDVFVFGSVDAGSESVEEQHLRWAGKTGVGLKVDPWILEPLQVRGGRTVAYDDADRAPHSTTPVPERSEFFIDVSTKLPVPVLGRPVNFEYNGTTPPPATTTERPRLNQDVRLALPLADGQSKLSVGARLPREDTPTQTPWMDRAQLYLGIELKH